MPYATVFLILSLTFVNGWTDAPNAIATAVTTRALTPRTAVFLCAACNLLGLLLGTLFAPALLKTMLQISVGLTVREAACASAAAMSACVLWAIIAWYFGIPTSESHGMLAGAIGGSAFFLGADALRSSAAQLAMFGLLFALLLGFLLGGFSCCLLHFLYKNTPRSKATRKTRRLQQLGAAASACLHGAQDGQKFLGMLLLCGLFPSTGPAILPIALLLTAGTALGGFRIIKRVGSLVPLTPTSGLAAECGSVITMLLATLFGIPISTTHAKTAAILGAGERRRMRIGSAITMVLAWIATFPICFLLAYILTRLFL